MIKKIEPPCWWVGMNTPLELMIYGVNLRSYDIKSLDEHIRIKEVHLVENPNYLFIDIEIPPGTPPGSYTFELTKENTKLSFQYPIHARKKIHLKGRAILPRIRFI